MSLLNKRQVRTFCLDYSQRAGRHHSRVAEDIYDTLEGKVRTLLRYYVDVSPGKTVSLTTKAAKENEE